MICYVIVIMVIERTVGLVISDGKEHMTCKKGVAGLRPTSGTHFLLCYFNGIQRE